VTIYHVITAEDQGEVEAITVTTVDGSEYPRSWSAATPPRTLPY
jgi:hypothetical protein